MATTRNSQETAGRAAAAGTGKLYYSISEVAELVNVRPHVLRYWETQFKMLRPRKNRAGNRSYRVKDVKMALRIKRLLYDEGFTIAGARRKLLDERRSGIAQTEIDFVGISREEFVKMLRRDLTELLAVLRGERAIESLGQAALAGDEERAAGGGDSGRGGLFRDLELADEDGEREARAGEGDERDEGDEGGRGAPDAGDEVVQAVAAETPEGSGAPQAPQAPRAPRKPVAPPPGTR